MINLTLTAEEKELLLTAIESSVAFHADMLDKMDSDCELVVGIQKEKQALCDLHQKICISRNKI